jgi:tetratricopeptide (TPR) repeat protein
MPAVYAATQTDPVANCERQVDSAPAAAIEACTTAIGSGSLSDADLERALRLRGTAYYNDQSHQLDKAIGDLSFAMQLDPNDAMAAFMRGRAWQDQHQDDKAIADFNESLRVDPDYAPAFVRRALSWGNKNAFDKGLADADAAIRTDPSLFEALGVRGALRQALNDDDGAMADFDEWVRRAPRSAQARIARGASWVFRDDGARALPDLDEAVRLAPRLAFAYLTRGRAWTLAMNDGMAMADYDRAIELDPNSALAFKSRGIAFYSAGTCDKALADDDQALQLAPGDAVLLTRRGNVRNCLQQFDAALVDFQEAVRIDSTPTRLRSLGMNWFDLGRFGDSAAALTSAANGDPQSLYTALWLFIARARAGDLAGAMPELDARASAVTASTWPAPVAALFLERLQPADLIAAARDPDSRRSREQTCEANFYTAEWLLIHQRDQAETTRLLEEAARTCPFDYHEADGAHAELSRAPH